MTNIFLPETRHIVLDIETLDILPTAAVIGIGARIVEIDSRGVASLCEEAILDLAGIEADEDTEDFYTVGHSTMEFWHKQSPALKDKYLPYYPTLSPLLAAKTLLEFCVEQRGCSFWSHHDAFDFGILNHMFKVEGISTPWKYNQVFDAATLTQAHGIPKSYNPNPHDAVADATNVANSLITFVNSYL